MFKETNEGQTNYCEACKANARRLKVFGSSAEHTCGIKSEQECKHLLDKNNKFCVKCGMKVCFKEFHEVKQECNCKTTDKNIHSPYCPVAEANPEGSLSDLPNVEPEVPEIIEIVERIVIDYANLSGRESANRAEFRELVFKNVIQAHQAGKEEGKREVEEWATQMLEADKNGEPKEIKVGGEFVLEQLLTFLNSKQI
jgi:hypothetical protein